MIGWINCAWGEVRKHDPAFSLQTEAAVLDLYRQRLVDPLIRGRFPLAQAREAVDQLERRATAGKLILTF